MRYLFICYDLYLFSVPWLLPFEYQPTCTLIQCDTCTSVCLHMLGSFSLLLRHGIRLPGKYSLFNHLILLDFSLTIKAAPHECVIRTSQP